MSKGNGGMLRPAWPEIAKEISKLTHPSATAMNAVHPKSKKVVLSFFLLEGLMNFTVPQHIYSVRPVN